MSTSASQSGTRRAAGIVGLAVIGSRLFGLLREVVFAAMFGAGKLLDAYLTAFRIPNLLRDLFAEGALSIAFTTVFTRTWEQDGEASAWELANLILTAMIFVIGSISIAAILVAPLLVDATSIGFHAVPGKFALAVDLTRILFPFILFVSLAAAAMGMLNARNVFGVPASASTVFNIVSVTAGVALAYAFDPGARAHWLHPVFTARALYGVSVGVLLGGLAQLGMQLPSLARLGFRYRWRLNLRDPRVAEVWRLMLPSVIAGSAVQINVLINSNFASGINGAQTFLFCAFRLAQLPIGMFGVALATATLPAVTRAATRGDLAAFGATAKDSVRLAFFLALPAAAGLAALADPIISLIYQHGRFSAYDAHQTALTLRAYAVGLGGYTAIRVLVPCFYALNLTRTPLRVSLIGIGLNLALNIANLVLNLGYVGLALITSAVALINFLQLITALGRRVALGGWMQWATYLGRCAGAAALCGAAAWGVDHLVEGASASRLIRATGLAAAIGAGAGVYFAAAWALRLQESADAWRMIRRRLPGGRRSAPP